MPVKPPFNIYREQFWPPHHGFPLWNPNPVEGVYNQVSIGDVGYISQGAFIRMFNVTLSWDNESNKALGEPYSYDPLRLNDVSIRREAFGKVDYYSRRVSREENAGNTQASSPDQAEGVTYTCQGRGALLSLPHGGLRQEVIQTKLFRKYMGDNVDDWIKWSKDKGLPVDHMQDLVFVYGCTLVTSWAAAAFDDHAVDAQVSLVIRMLKNGGSSFVWSNIRGTVECHDSQLDPNNPHALQNLCVFIKCLRAKRTLFFLSPHSYLSSYYEESVTSSEHGDTIDSHQESVIGILEEGVIDNIGSVTNIPQEDVIVNSRGSVPDISQEDVINNDRGSVINSCQESVIQALDVPQYLDPLIGVLSYIEEIYLEDSNNTEGSMVVADDNDLLLIEEMDSLTEGAIARFLHDKKAPTVVEDGVLILSHPQWQANEHEESDKRPGTSYEASISVDSDFSSRPLVQRQNLPPRRSDTGDNQLTW